MILLMIGILNRVNKTIKIKGWVAERLNAPALKAGDSLRSSWVRISPHPPKWVFFDSNRPNHCGYGGIGRQSRLKICWDLVSCRFESDYPHQYGEIVQRLGHTAYTRASVWYTRNLGSNPSLSTNSPSLAQPGSAPALGAGCRRFKSYNSDHFKNSGEN